MLRIITDINLIAAVLCIIVSIMCFVENLGLIISIFCILAGVLNFVMFFTKDIVHETFEILDDKDWINNQQGGE